MRRTTTFLLAFLLAALDAPAAFATSEWRTEVQVTVGTGTSTEFAFDGGLNVPSSFQQISTPTNSGMSQAAASLSPTGFVPTLQALAVNDGTRAQAVAWGVQSYTNVSADPVATALQMHLTADIVGSNDVWANMYLLLDANFEYSPDPGTLLFETTSELWPGFDAGILDVFVNDTEGPVDELRQFDFTVAPGESFYVWARLVATANELGEADAFSTLTASFTNTEGLSPAAVVPEPGSAGLLALGLLGLSLGARSRGR